MSGRIFNSLFTANLPRNLPMTKIVNRLRFGSIMAMSLWHHFLAHCCCIQVPEGQDSVLLLARRHQFAKAFARLSMPDVIAIDHRL